MQRVAGQHAQFELQGVRRTECTAAHLDQPARVLVNPTAGCGLDLERRRHPQLLPDAADLNKDALPVRAEQPEPAVHRGQESVDADMALRDHGVEDAGHPGGGGEGGLVGNQVRATAQDVAMRALHQQFFGAQHDMAVVTMEERQQRVVVALLVPARRAEQGVDVGAVEVERRQHRRVAEQAASADRADRADSAKRSASARSAGSGSRRRREPLRFRQVKGGIHQRQVAGCRGGGMVGLHPAEEAELGLLARRQGQRGILDSHQRMFMLQALAGQTLGDALRQPARTQRQAMHLQPVGGECGATPQ